MTATYREEAAGALAEIDASIEHAWMVYRGQRPSETDEQLARFVVADPSRHSWRLVEAAMAILQCPECGASLGGGLPGCGSCDMADGFRFGGQEVDRPGVQPGNEHAIRVSSAVLRSPRRYPDWAVRGNELYLPLFVAGLMPSTGRSGDPSTGTEGRNAPKPRTRR